MRRWDGWPDMVARAGTLGYEGGYCNDGVVPADRLATISGPVLALADGASPAWAAGAAEAIAAAAPGSRAEIVAGQTHNPAPEVLAPLLARALL